MVDNSAAKSRLNVISEALDRKNMTELDSLVFKRSMDLYSCLSEESLYVDDTIKSKLQEVYDKLHDTTAASIRHYLSKRITDLNTAITASGTKAKDKPALQTKLDDYENRLKGIDAREGNYNKLVTNANKFKNDTLDNLDFNINAATPRGVGAGTVAIDLDSKFLTAGGTTVDDYVLCDKDGNKLSSTANSSGGRNYKINIGGVEHTLVDVRISGADGSKQLNCSNMTITPPLSDFPKEIDLSVNGVFNSATVGAGDINVVCNKKFKLKLNDGTVTLDNAARGSEFDNYNNALPAGHKIENIIETNFEGNRHELERNALAKILEKNGGTQYATLNAEQKEDFYQRIRNFEPVAGTTYFDSVLIAENINTDSDRFDEFRNWFIGNDKSWNKGDNIKSNHNYITFIHNNISSKVGEFISSKLDHFLGNITQETLLKSELTGFINDIENNKLDNDNDIFDDINRYASHESHQIDRKRRYNIGRSSDANYMRFFSGSSTNLRGEVVNIRRNTTPEGIGIAGPLKYDMNLQVSGTNSIEVEIKIEGERDPIRIKSGDPAALVRKIMRDCRIEHGKARAHMGFNIYKAMVQMAKDNNISLQYRDDSVLGNPTRYIDIIDGNILIREVDNLTGRRGGGRIIFDQKKFMNSNEFAGAGENSSLRTGIDELGRHFTIAMNQLHNQYRHGVEKKFGTLFSSNSKIKLPTSFWSSPIKKLLNFRDTTNFDFSTTVASKGKNININFEKNKFTVSMEGLEKPIESKDLGKILNTRHKGIRIFDGKERDILEGVYTNLINKLRENGRIANTDFGVMDNITGNMFILDMDGRFGVIARENLNSEGSPLRSGEYGRLNHRSLELNTVDWFDHGSPEEKELMRNPFLMQRFVKAMNKRLGRW